MMDMSAKLRTSWVRVGTAGSSERSIAPLSIAGYVTLRVRVAASAPSIDVIGRLCLVTPLGGSVNLCEGLQCVETAAGAEAAGVGGERGVDVTVSLGPVGADFAAGSRVPWPISQ